MAIHEIQQVMWLDTPNGEALAKFLVDRGVDADNEWICVVNETGEIWSFLNADVRVSKEIHPGPAGGLAAGKCTGKGDGKWTV
jgi:hypothetical protein